MTPQTVSLLKGAAVTAAIVGGVMVVLTLTEPWPSFYWTATGAIICLIVAVVTWVGVVVGQTTHAQARVREESPQPSEPPLTRPVPLDAPPPVFNPLQDAERGGWPVYGAMQRGDGEPGRLVRVERFAPITITDDNDWPAGLLTQAVADGAKERDRTRREQRDAYWTQRGRELAEDANVRDEFGALLDGMGRLDPAAVKARAAAAVRELSATAPALPHITSGAVPVEAVRVQLQANRDHALEQAKAMQDMVDSLADEVGDLRGRVIGQIGMAAAAQGMAAEREADIASATLPLMERMQEEGPQEVQRVLRELGWLVSMENLSPQVRELMRWGWRG